LVKKGYKSYACQSFDSLGKTTGSLEWSLTSISAPVKKEYEVFKKRISKQKGTKDCGLFSLGYSLALAIDIGPAMLVCDQNEIRIFITNNITNQTKNNY
ncbi:hypothetical protein BpHYR1_042776, partial [Brachionus plicatilis]